MSTARSRVHSQRGFAVALVLPLAALLGIAIYILPDMYLNAKRRTVQTDRIMQIRTVAHNLKELGKLLLLYERVVYTQDPLSLEEARLNAQRELWPQSFGTVGAGTHHMINSCGGFDAMANYVGDLKLMGQPVFCSFYFRNSMLTGKMLEDMVFQKWSKGGSTKIIQRVSGMLETQDGVMASVVQGGSGRYTVEIDMTNALYNSDQQAFDVVLSSDLRELLRNQGGKARIVFEFYTDSFGFRSPGNDRFLKVWAGVEFNDGFDRRELIEQDTFAMFTPTMKDFAIFMPYPTTQDGNPTNRMSESLQLGGANSKVLGRVYFNGNIDIPLASLPTFYETVVISGTLIPEPDPASMEILRQKFKKGIIVNFSAQKYLLDGICGQMSGADVNINNQSGMFCRKGGVDFGISDYIENLQNMCSDSTINVVANGSYTYDFSESAYPNPMRAESCRPQRFVRGGVNNVSVNSPYVFVISPVKKLVATSPTNVYGLVMGGYVRAAGGTTFVSMPYLKTGMAGIGTAEQLGAINAEAAQIYEGVSVPLLGFPLIQTAKEGMN